MCKYVEGTAAVMPGWGCCRCRVYNGLQRSACKSCREQRHEITVTQELFFCDGCGFGCLPDHVAGFGFVCPSCRVGTLGLAPTANDAAEARS
jgi:hypothetical protein